MKHNNKIPSRRINRKDTSKRDMVSQVVHTQISVMGLAAPLSAAVRGRDALQFNTPHTQVGLTGCYKTTINNLSITATG